MENLTFKTINNVAIVSIDRPEALNALNLPTVVELDEVIEQIKGNSEIKVLIIGGEGNFAAGADIKSMVDCDTEKAKSFSFSPIFQKIVELKIPTIAAIDGYALGGGLELALTCDLRIATETAKLGFPEINVGIMPGAGGTIRAPKIVGEAKAKELILLGENINARQAEQLGLVNKVVEKEQLMETALNWAEKLCKKAPIALAVAKQTIREGMALSDTKDALKIEDKNWASLFATEDQKEGMRAFIEKRKPVYKGR